MSLPLEDRDQLMSPDLTCFFCGCAFQVYRMTEEIAHLPICAPCKRAGRGEGCEANEIYPLSRGD